MMENFETGMIPSTRFLLERDASSFIYLDLNFDGLIDVYKSIYQEDGESYINDGNGNLVFNSSTFPELQSSDNIFRVEQEIAGESGILHFIDGGGRYNQLFVDKDEQRTEIVFLPKIHINSIDDYKIIDINKDGYKDIFFAGRWGHALYYFLGSANRRFGDIQYVTNIDEGVRNFNFADINNDGNLDICYSSIWGGK